MPRISPDGYDILVLPLSGGTSTHINTGTAGSAGNFIEYGAPVNNALGLLNINNSKKGLYIPGSIIVTSVRNGAGGGNDVISASPNISLSGWVFIRRYPNVPGEIFNKQYFLNGWSSPFLTFGFQMHTTQDGQIDLYITSGGVLQTQLRAPSNYGIPVGRWCHLGGTWDGTTMRMYINGSLATSAAYIATIDYGSAENRGQWYVGGIPGTSTNQETAMIVQDIRVANIARPQSYFAEIYYNGFLP